MKAEARGRPFQVLQTGRHTLRSLRALDVFSRLRDNKLRDRLGHQGGCPSSPLNLELETLCYLGSCTSSQLIGKSLDSSHVLQTERHMSQFFYSSIWFLLELTCPLVQAPRAGRRSRIWIGLGPHTRRKCPAGPWALACTSSILVPSPCRSINFSFPAPGGRASG